MTETLPAFPQVHALNPQPSSRRNGKIARLPKETREMINHMLDDGIPYHVIIDELGDAGEGLNTQNLTNWKHGGYQEWIKSQELIEQTRAQTETAIDLLRQTDGAANAAKVVEACHLVGSTQLLHGLLDHGDEALKKLLVDNPDTYIRILNIICRLADSGLRYEKKYPLPGLTTINPSSFREGKGQSLLTGCGEEKMLIKPNQGKSSLE